MAFIFILLAFCLTPVILPTVVLGFVLKGRSLLETLLLIVFFVLISFVDGMVVSFLYHDSDLDDWMCLVGPICAAYAFGIILAGALPKFRWLALRGALASVGAVILAFGTMVASGLMVPD